MKVKSKTKTNKFVGMSDIARKYNCSRSYVSFVVNKGGNSIKAKKIEKDLNDIKEIVDRETIITI